MPCLGPEINHEEVERAYQEIMEFLKVKYRIQDGDPPPFILSTREKDLEHRRKANEQFKVALTGLFRLQSYEDF